MKKHKDKTDISNLLDIMDALRNPDSGCPWDLEQDFATIAPYTIEEAYEVADCIERGDLAGLPDELGDLLLQVVFHARLGAEQDLFDFGDVVTRISDKMVRRHPHVFGDAAASSSDEVSRSWEAIKREEELARGGQPAADASLLGGVTLGLPALSRALKLGRRAAGVGFDWPALAPVRAKLDEELAELDEAIAAGDARSVEAELGDLLFSVVNLARHLQVDPEQALRRANDRFVWRFSRVEQAVQGEGGDWSAFTPAALDEFWNAAKAVEQEVVAQEAGGVREKSPGDD